MAGRGHDPPGRRQPNVVSARDVGVPQPAEIRPPPRRGDARTRLAGKENDPPAEVPGGRPKDSIPSPAGVHPHTLLCRNLDNRRMAPERRGASEPRSRAARTTLTMRRRPRRGGRPPGRRLRARGRPVGATSGPAGATGRTHAKPLLLVVVRRDREGDVAEGSSREE